MQDQLKVVELSLKQLGLLDQIRFSRKPAKSGRKLTPMETIKAVWKFRQSAENTSESTLTSKPARTRVENKHQTQVGLEFSDAVKIII